MATKKIYATYRSMRINGTMNLGNMTFSGIYSPSFFLNSQFFDYAAAGYTIIFDSLIADSQYTATLFTSGIPKLSRFMVMQYDDTKTSDVEFGNISTSVGSLFNVDIFEDIATAQQWIRDNTNLVESPTGTFKLTDAYTGPFGPVAATYLVID